MASVNCFKLLATVLDDAYAAIPPEGRDDKIKDALAGLSKTYLRLSVDGGPDFADPVVRFAYVFRYVTMNANLVARLIEETPALRTVLKQERLTLSCLGGGPGSDLVGVLKHLGACEASPIIQCYICDGEGLWGETWGDVGNRLDYPALRVTFLQQNVRDRKKWEQMQKYLGADLFTLVYFASEVYAHRDEAAPYFVNLFERAKSGALFLYVDNESRDFNDWFDGIVKSAPVEVLVSKADERARLPSEEQKGDLKKYMDKFGQQPRLTGQVAFRVLRRR